MSDLQDESVIQTAEETLDDWERVSAGFANTALPAERRRFLLLLSKAEGFNRKTIGDTGLAFGITVTGIELPFRPAFFGFSRFGLDRIAGPAAFSALRVHASGGADESSREAFENALSSQVLSNYITHFIYGGA
jgi:hypothetical protein